MGRAAALLVLLAALALYYAFHDRLWSASTWWDIAFLGVVLIPACFGLVWLVLPLWQGRGLIAVAFGFGLLAWACHDAGWNTPENFCKLFGVTAVGFAFLRWFELLSWVALVACIIPFVDSISVFAPHGPTNEIVKHHEHVFTTFSFAFPIPGESAAANLGLPDLLFFSLFLAACARFALRTGFTWLAMTASFGATLAIASVWRGGLPALPLLAIGFLVVNADLIWPRVRRERLSLRS